MPQALPDIRKEEVVLFHRDLHFPSSWIVLQIPVKGKANKSNSYRIDLEKTPDRVWFQRIPMEREISVHLSLYGHVVYFPLKKEAVPIEDKSVTDLTLTQQLFSQAHADKGSPQGRWNNVKLGVRRIRHPLKRS